jgi:hypothetical protein
MLFMVGAGTPAPRSLIWPPGYRTFALQDNLAEAECGYVPSRVDFDPANTQ